ncbi:MAG: hypothetical protein KDC27_15275, partial [Acidobacteria bacterium]|nr:hypothetical protein [Acidobacteriota bacterium]
MSRFFHNPYHFVPVKEKRDATWVPAKQWKGLEAPPCYHHRYYTEPSAHSGRIVCRLTAETPFFIGAKREQSRGNEIARLHGFSFDGLTPAIPASSLRGMVGSLAEAASNSALRVL